MRDISSRSYNTTGKITVFDVHCAVDLVTCQERIISKMAHFGKQTHIKRHIRPESKLYIPSTTNAINTYTVVSEVKHADGQMWPPPSAFRLCLQSISAQ